MPVQFPMVDPTHRNRELVADLAAEGPRLGKTQMVGIGRRSAAHQAGLGGNELAVILVAQPDGLGRYPAAADLGLVCRRVA